MGKMKRDSGIRVMRCADQSDPSQNRTNVRTLIICAMFFLFEGNYLAADTNQISTPIDITVRIKKQHAEARARFQAETNNADAAWQFARSCFDLGEIATSDAEREKTAQSGIAASRKAIASRPTAVQGHYYLALNLGQLARTKMLGALRIVDQMESTLSVARTLDEHFDFAGPDRSLGLLYLEAPSFGSIGSRSKARQHLRRAVELAPDYPGNRLELVGAYMKWGDRKTALHEFKILENLLPAARQKFVGEEWAASWVGWEKQIKSLKQRLDAGPKPLETPRQSD
jgi:tetratricopeptide (TPR) repeat protein